MAIRSVILPLEFSEGAERAVARWVRSRYVSVLECSPSAPGSGGATRTPATDLALLTDAIRAVTDPPRIYDRFASNAIGEFTRPTPDSLLCMATRGREGLAHLTGSVAEEVLRQVDTPDHVTPAHWYRSVRSESSPTSRATWPGIGHARGIGALRRSMGRDASGGRSFRGSLAVVDVRSVS